MLLARLSEVPQEEYGRLLQRSRQQMDDLVPTVRAVMEDVRARGDAALRDYTQRFDHAQLETLEVTPEELAQAGSQVEPEVIAALKHAASTIRAFHSRHLPPEGRVETEPGVSVWRVWRPIERVGLYIPGGKATYPSSILMNVIPAKIAGCQDIVLCSPPRSDGTISPVLLVAAQIAGVQRIFKLGGVQAIAAMAYGTESVPRVLKIFGAGNAYVATAKLLAFGEVDIDMPAGPTELLILADETANPRFVAADLVAQAEHAEDSACVLITTSRTLAEQVAAEIAAQLETLETRKYAEASLERYGALLVADALDEAITFANTYAPEHLQIITADDQRVLEAIQNAGSVFLGNWSPSPAGDYATGSNHVLPTGRYARVFAPLSVESFGRKMQVQEATRDGLERLRATVERLATEEGLPGHQHSIAVRFEAGADAQGARTLDLQVGNAQRFENTLDARPARLAVIGRVTKETNVQITLNLDGEGNARIQTSVPFLDHLLNSFARHGRFDLEVTARGDTEIDDHHTVEDIGIVLGQVLQHALGTKRGIARFGSAYAPMDEALARTVLDISGRPFLGYEAPGLAPWVGRFDTALVEEFWRAFTNNAQVTLHLDIIRGKNAHHMLEALFKSAGLALHAATRIASPDGSVPSTKGVL
ncbi:MAG TPA: histidinol dehydrogenase [Ktedonobacterales bacterium]|jgi:histidinol dehydrogenase